jgi:hypothetical protein
MLRCSFYLSVRSLKGTETAKIRARKAAEGRWRKHRTDKSLATAISELEEAEQNLRRKLHTVAIVSGEKYESLIEECLADIARVLRE